MSEEENNPLQPGNASGDGVGKPGLSDEQKDVLISSLRSESASRRIENRTLKEQLAELVKPEGKTPVVASPSVNPYEEKFNKLQSQFNNSELRNLAKDKNVDPETLAALVHGRKMDISSSDFNKEVDELIKEKSLAKKDMPSFGGYGGATKTSGSTKSAKTLGELIGMSGSFDKS